jgi:adhesin transport system membrane fusion protein
MTTYSTLDLSGCTEFAQTLQARPPRLVHTTVVLLTALLAGALLWAGLTRADLVVKAAGRIRPVTAPQKVFSHGRGEVLSAGVGGRVIEVRYTEGQEVRQGDVLVRLATDRLDTDLDRRRQLLRTAHEELACTRRLEQATLKLCQTARGRAAADLAQLEKEVAQAKERQAQDVRLAETELSVAQDEEQRLRRSGRGVSEVERVRGRGRLDEARTKMARARLPVEEGRVAVCREALALTQREEVVKKEEFALRREQKQGEVRALRLELAGLELERRHAAVCAPSAGVVTTRPVKVGDLLEAGKPVLEIAAQRGFRFEVAVSSEDVGDLCEEMPARIKLDAYDYQRYGTLEGVVEFIAADSTVLEGQPSSVFLVRIRVDESEVGHGEFRGRVKLGMTGQAELATARESLLSLLVKRIRKSVRLG